jgi:RNA polymerase sigma factor (sigma-70 family)
MDREQSAGSSSIELLELARAGDDAALNRLFERYLPRLTRWAKGRLPAWARDVSDTDDLVQETLVRTIRGLPNFQAQGDGALQAYLREAILNRIRDEIRRRQRRPAPTPLESGVSSADTTPLEAAIGAETLARYDRALETLEPAAKEAVIARVEMGCSYAEIADMLAKPSPDAARMTVSRALLSLAEAMRHAR